MQQLRKKKHIQVSNVSINAPVLFLQVLFPNYNSDCLNQKSFFIEVWLGLLVCLLKGTIIIIWCLLFTHLVGVLFFSLLDGQLYD